MTLEWNEERLENRNDQFVRERAIQIVHLRFRFTGSVHDAVNNEGESIGSEAVSFRIQQVGK